MTTAVRIAATLVYSLTRSRELAFTAPTRRQGRLLALFSPSNSVRLRRFRNPTLVGATGSFQLPPSLSSAAEVEG